MSSLIYVVHGGGIHQIGLLYPHLFIVEPLPASAQNLQGLTVFSRGHLHILAMIAVFTQRHHQVLYMIIRY